MLNEARLYQKALREAKEHLARWEELGKTLDKTLSAAWENVRVRRKAEVQQIEALIQRAKNRL